MRKFLSLFVTILFVLIFISTNGFTQGAPTWWPNAFYMETFQNGLGFGNGAIFSAQDKLPVFEGKRLDDRSKSIYFQDDIEAVTTPDFSCLDGGVIGGGTLISSFVSVDSALPLDGTKSLAFTIPATSTGYYCLLNSSSLIPVPSFAQSKRQLLTFESRFDGNAGDISLFLWDTTNSGTIKDSAGATLYINPANGVNSNKLWLETSATANLQWGVIINTPNTGKILTLDNLQIDGSPDKEISVYASSEWESFNGSFTNVNIGTGGSATFLKRRVGENQEISIYFNLGAGGSVSGDIIFNLPAKMNTSVFGSQNFNRIMGSVNSFNSNGTGNSINARVIQNSTLDNQVLFQDNSSTVYNTTTPFSWGDNDIFFATFTYPVKGWSDKEDNVVVSGTKANYAYVEAVGNAGEAITANVTDIPFIATDNAKGLWNGSQFTADRDMVVSFSGGVYFGAVSDRYLSQYVNGIETKRTSVEYTDSAIVFSGMQKLKVGDTLSVRDSVGGSLQTGNTILHHLTIKELPNYEDLILAYLDESNAATSGVERRTTRSLDGKPIYETYLKTTQLYTATTSAVWTLPPNLKPINAHYVEANSWILSSFTSTGTAYSQLNYNDITGNVDLQMSTYTVPAGSTYHIEYTK